MSGFNAVCQYANFRVTILLQWSAQIVTSAWLPIAPVSVCESGMKMGMIKRLGRKPEPFVRSAWRGRETKFKRHFKKVLILDQQLADNLARGGSG